MTINKLPNQDDIQQRSALQGRVGDFHATFPSAFDSATSGGGVVATYNTGTEISPGATAGDKAHVYGIGQNPSRRFAGADLIRTTTIFNTSSGATAGMQDAFKIGLTLSDKGAGLDLTNETYSVGGRTTPATVNADSEEVSKLVVEADADAGETRFEQSGAVNETATIGSLPFALRINPIVRSESNGEGDESLYLRFQKVELIL